MAIRIVQQDWSKCMWTKCKASIKIKINSSTNTDGARDRRPYPPCRPCCFHFGPFRSLNLRAKYSVGVSFSRLFLFIESIKNYEMSPWFAFYYFLLISFEFSRCLGADISLPHCLTTGIWNLAPKAITRPKSRGTSWGMALWRHAQMYCA